MKQNRLYVDQLEWLIATLKDDWKRDIIHEIITLFKDGEIETDEYVRFNEIRMIETFDLIFSIAKEGIDKENEERESLRGVNGPYGR
ncbi:MAG: hypothetical protein ACRCUM_02730 [Mycoplasmoidaceae bacterium]